MKIGVELCHKNGSLFASYEIGSDVNPGIPFIPGGSSKLRLREIKKILRYFNSLTIRGWHVNLMGDHLFLISDDCKVRFMKVFSTRRSSPDIYHAGRTKIDVDLSNLAIHVTSQFGHPHVNGSTVCLGSSVGSDIIFDPTLPIKLIEWAETYVGVNPYNYLNSVYDLDSKNFIAPKRIPSIVYFLSNKYNFTESLGDEGFYVNRIKVLSLLNSEKRRFNFLIDSPFSGDLEFLNEKIKEALIESSFILFYDKEGYIFFNSESVDKNLDFSKIYEMNPLETDFSLMRYDLNALRERTSFDAEFPQKKTK